MAESDAERDQKKNSEKHVEKDIQLGKSKSWLGDLAGGNGVIGTREMHQSIWMCIFSRIINEVDGSN